MGDLEYTKEPGVCIVCGKPANTRMYKWYRLYTTEAYRACSRQHANVYVNLATHPEDTNIRDVRDHK